MLRPVAGRTGITTVETLFTSQVALNVVPFSRHGVLAGRGLRALLLPQGLRGSYLGHMAYGLGLEGLPGPAWVQGWFLRERSP